MSQKSITIQYHCWTINIIFIILSHNIKPTLNLLIYESVTSICIQCNRRFSNWNIDIDIESIAIFQIVDIPIYVEIAISATWIYRYRRYTKKKQYRPITSVMIIGCRIVLTGRVLNQTDSSIESFLSEESESSILICWTTSYLQSKCKQSIDNRTKCRNNYQGKPIFKIKLM